ncbi:MAG TPA: ABC transporter permease [Pyrinomonadaceae bacterium]|nr:ABC transporter permease [Pyrinomonadaceae bacterium]
MDSLIKDIRYAIRSLIKRPGFIAVAIITLALGIGANTAIFSVINAVVLRPLPYDDPDRLVMVWETIAGNDRRSVAPGNYVDWRDHNTTFTELSAAFNGNFNLTGDGEPERINGATVTSNLMKVLGVQAQLGRTFQPEDDAGRGNSVVLISDGLWKRRFGADRNIVGRSLAIDETPFTVVGVMPAGFQFPAKSDLWVLGRDRNAVSLSLISQFPANDWTHERDAHFLSVVGRLKPGATLSQAQSDIAGIARRAEQEFPQTNEGLSSNVVSLHIQIVGDVQGLLFILLGAVALVLLIACTNVANLMLARSVKREREMAIRVAVGAGRWRLIRQLLTESLLLSLAGGVAGLLLSTWAVHLFIKLSPGNIPRLEEASVDLRLLGFAFIVSLLTGVGFGLLPAFHATRVRLSSALKEGGKTTSGRLHRSTRNTLIASEIALAQILLVGAGLLILSYVRASQVDPGFNPQGVLTAKIAPSAKKYPNPKAKAAFYSVVLDRLSHLPGVQSVGMVMNLPLSGSSMNRGFRAEGRPEPKADENITMDYQVVSEDYFRAMDVPVVRGRTFTKADTETSERVIVINQALARRYWPNEDPIGRRMAIGESSKETSWRTIVGVVGDMRHASLSEPAVPTAFTVYTQDLESWPRMAFVVKSDSNPAALTSAVRSSLVSIDPSQPVYAIEPMEKLITEQIAPRRFVMSLIALLASVALVLSAVGVYGVISFSVSERTQEMGIRMALGAGKRDVLALVLGQSARIAAVGIVVGLIGAFALTRLMATLLFEVSPTDPITFAAVAVLLGVVALIACYIPARRATKVDPVVALRYE